MLQFPGSPGLAFGAGSSGAATVRADKDAVRAEYFLDRLEFEKGRLALESAIHDASKAQAAPRAIAKLWALLGRAHAELGDEEAMDQAFAKAVSLDRQVKLSRTNSPKILEALERARAAAPRQENDAPPAEETKTAKIKAGAKPGPGSKVDQQQKPSASLGPTLRHRFVGEVAPGKSIKLVVEHWNLPRRAVLEAMVKKTLHGRFVPIRLIQTGTVAELTLTMDRPRIELYVRARSKGSTVAQLGSELKPFELSATPSAPSMADAWSEAPTAFTRTSSSSGTASSSVAVAAAPHEEKDGGLGEEEVAWILAGGTVLAAAAIIIAIVVASSARQDCEAPRGYGCAEIVVDP